MKAYLCRMIPAVFFFLALTNFVSSGASYAVEWEKGFGGPHGDVGWDMQKTTDGGYIIVGEYTREPGYWDMYLIKVDSEGNELWSLISPGPGNTAAGYAVQQTSDGGYIVAGKADTHLFLLKADGTGHTQWTFKYPGRRPLRIINLKAGVTEAVDGGYVAVATIHNPTIDDADVYLIKTDSEGQLLWSRTYGGPGDDKGSSLRRTSDGGYIITGAVDFSPDGYYGQDVLLLKVDGEGRKLWWRTFGEKGIYDEGRDIQQTSDGGYIITGIKYFNGAPFNELYLLKTDASGNELWTGVYGGREGEMSNEYGYSVQQTSDDGFIVAGAKGYALQGDSDLYLLKTDRSGNKLWDKTFGLRGPGCCGEVGYSVQLAGDGGYMIAGSSQSIAATIFPDVYLLYYNPEPGGPGPVPVLPDVRANDFDGPLVISSGDPLFVTVELEAGAQEGRNSDLWILAKTPWGFPRKWFSYDLASGTWKRGIHASYQGPCSSINPLEVLGISGLPTGEYVFYFGVDFKMDGSPDTDTGIFDQVKVTVTE